MLSNKSYAKKNQSTEDAEFVWVSKCQKGEGFLSERANPSATVKLYDNGLKKTILF
jgi:hypothetical protein